MVLQSHNKQLASLFASAALFLGSLSPLSAAWNPVPFEFPNTIADYSFYVSSMAADANGNAVVITAGNNPSPVTDVEAWNYANGIWSQSILIPSTDLVSASSVSVAMNSGTALALVHGLNIDELRAYFYDGVSWTGTNPTTLDTPLGSDNPSIAVAMNGPNSGVAVWINGTAVNAAFFTAGNWGPIIPIGAGTETEPQQVSVALDPNGNALAVWQAANSGGVYSRSFTSTTTGSLVVLDANGFIANDLFFKGAGNLHNVGLDASGNGVAVWINNSGQVIANTFLGATQSWLALPVTLDTSTGGTGPTVAVAPGGTAVATWVDSFGNGISSSFDGTLWSSSIRFTNDPVNGTSYPSIAVDNAGNALAVWATDIGEIRSSLMLLGSAWGPLELVGTTTTTDPFTTISVVSALSSNGTGFASWIDDSQEIERDFVFANVNNNLIVAPPGGIFGRVFVHDFPTITDRIHSICWSASTDPSVVAYYVRRNDELVAIVPSTSPLRYCDHFRCRKCCDVYTVTAVSSNGSESTPVTISLR